MKTYYIIEMPAGIKPAIADVSAIGNHLYMINRINVPEGFRGRGYGSELLKMVLEAADAENATLILSVYASGDMTDEQLYEWYGRHGFEIVESDNHLMRRRRHNLPTYKQKFCVQ